MGNKAIPIFLTCGLFASVLVTYAPDTADYPGVGHVADYPLESYKPTDVPGKTIDNGSVSKRWDLSRIMAPQAWQTVSGGSGVIVAVLDTGIDSHNEDLVGKVVDSINFTRSPTLGDVYGHGTHIAGIIAAIANNNLGTVGLAYNCTLLNVKVVEDDGSADAATVARGIIWAADNGAKTINISLVINKPVPALEEAVEYAWGRGCIIVAAAGNGFSSAPVYPAAYPHVIAVAATDRDDSLARWSNNGEWITVAAPGVDIYSTLPNDNYAYKSGTSYASALVSGEAALLFADAADLNGDGRINDELLALIRNNCANVTGSGLKVGRINVLEAARVASSMRPLGSSN